MCTLIPAVVRIIFVVVIMAVGSAPGIALRATLGGVIFEFVVDDNLGRTVMLRCGGSTHTAPASSARRHEETVAVCIIHLRMAVVVLRS